MAVMGLARSTPPLLRSSPFSVVRNLRSAHVGLFDVSSLPGSASCSSVLFTATAEVALPTPLFPEYRRARRRADLGALLGESMVLLVLPSSKMCAAFVSTVPKSSVWAACRAKNRFNFFRSLCDALIFRVFLEFESPDETDIAMLDKPSFAAPRRRNEESSRFSLPDVSRPALLRDLERLGDLPGDTNDELGDADDAILPMVGRTLLTGLADKAELIVLVI